MNRSSKEKDLGWSDRQGRLAFLAILMGALVIAYGYLAVREGWWPF